METFSALLAICAGNSPVPGEFHAQRPVTRSFDVFFDLRLNKRLSKQSWGWWFETLSRPLWRHRNGNTETKQSILSGTLPQSVVPANVTVSKGAAIGIFAQEMKVYIERKSLDAMGRTLYKRSKWIELTNLGRYTSSPFSLILVLDLGDLIWCRWHMS